MESEVSTEWTVIFKNKCFFYTYIATADYIRPIILFPLFWNNSVLIIQVTDFRLWVLQGKVSVKIFSYLWLCLSWRCRLIRDRLGKEKCHRFVIIWCCWLLCYKEQSSGKVSEDIFHYYWKFIHLYYTSDLATKYNVVCCYGVE